MDLKMEPINESTSHICNLLDQKLDAFRNFLSATVSLQEMSDIHDFEKIEALIEKRQDCVTTIDRIDTRISETKKDDLSSVSALPDKSKIKIEATVKAIEDTAVKAAHLNKELETMLQIHHGNIKNQLIKFSQSRDGIKKGYIPNIHKESKPRFLDIKT